MEPRGAPSQFVAVTSPGCVKRSCLYTVITVYDSRSSVVWSAVSSASVEFKMFLVAKSNSIRGFVHPSMGLFCGSVRPSGVSQKPQIQRNSREF